MRDALRAGAFGLIAAVIGFIAAPPMLEVVVLLGSDWMPAGLLRVAGHLAYETGFWFSGLAVFLIARRLTLLSSRCQAVAVILAPSWVETLGLLLFGRLAPRVATWTGFTATLLVASAAIGLGVWLTRSPAQQ